MAYWPTRVRSYFCDDTYLNKNSIIVGFLVRAGCLCLRKNSFIQLTWFPNQDHVLWWVRQGLVDHLKDKRHFFVPCSKQLFLHHSSIIVKHFPLGEQFRQPAKVSCVRLLYGALNWRNTVCHVRMILSSNWQQIEQQIKSRLKYRLKWYVRSNQTTQNLKWRCEFKLDIK